MTSDEHNTTHTCKKAVDSVKGIVKTMIETIHEVDYNMCHFPTECMIYISWYIFHKPVNNLLYNSYDKPPTL